MKRIKKMFEIKKDTSYGLIIGNFDGVHNGHQYLLKKIKKNCDKKNQKLLALTFVPHPATILFNKKSFLINSYKERKELLLKSGVDIVAELNFTKDFSLQSPEDFLEKYVALSTCIKIIYVGHDFSFGKNKKGDYSFLKKYCESKGMDVELLDEYKDGSKKMSSSVIREYLKMGKIALASKMLGRPFSLFGKVKRGKGRGKKMGWPTANLELDEDRIVPQFGVYATGVKFKDKNYLSLTHIGENPTFCDEKKTNIETYIHGFKEDLYGEFIFIEFFDKIRDEKKFLSQRDLETEIKKDLEKRKAMNTKFGEF